MSNRFAHCAALVVAAVAALAFASAASAEMLVIQIDAEAGGESASYTWVVPKVLDADQHMDWSINTPVTLSGAHGVIATIDSLNMAIDGDPGVSNNFNVTAGGTTTNFTITSSTVSFAAILNPAAYASAGITLTDTDSNGATLTGLFAGGKAFEAVYNTSVVWADIVSGISGGADTTVVTMERQPVAGRQLILASVIDIHSQFKFSVTANDQASGTSRFDVIEAVPEPGTIALFGSGALGLLGFIRRRKM